MARHKVHERRLARESALALLYSSDITEQKVGQIVEEGAYPAEDVDLTEYAEALVLGVAERSADIDEKLASTSENWAVDRMPVVDRAILRLAVYEMLYVDDVPVSVAINEAVELAKAFGGEDDSARFVNGVLGRIARSLEGGEEVAPEDEPAAEPESEAAPAAESAIDPEPEADSAPAPAEETSDAE